MRGLYELTRTELQDILENNLGMQVYDSETDDDLREALVECLDDEVMEGVVCRPEEVDECKAQYWYRRENGYNPEDLQFEGLYPSEDVEPLGFVIATLTDLKSISPDLLRFFDLSAYWSELKLDYETLDTDDGIQVWRK